MSRFEALVITESEEKGHHLRNRRLESGEEGKGSNRGREGGEPKRLVTAWGILYAFLRLLKGHTGNRPQKEKNRDITNYQSWQKETERRRAPKQRHGPLLMGMNKRKRYGEEEKRERGGGSK